MKREWMLRCCNCPMLRVELRRPSVGSFHWSEKGKCEATPELYVREVSKWERVEIAAAAGVSVLSQDAEELK